MNDNGMDRLRFDPVPDDDLESVVEWITADEWPFHGNPRPTAAGLRERLAAEGAGTSAVMSTWVIDARGERVGLVRLLELDDPTPMFDLRVRSDQQGRGIGEAALRWLTAYVFTTWPEKIRVEGQTRRDNVAMRCCFVKCGYVKEAHYRGAWPDPEGNLHDSIAYGITREDWATGKVTPVEWNDEPTRARRSAAGLAGPDDDHASSLEFQLRPLAEGESSRCEALLRGLPEWFGIESAIVQYASDVASMETWCAWSGDELAGFATVNQRFECSAEIHVMAVARLYHRRGVGRALVERIESLVAARGVEYLQVKTLSPGHPDRNYAKTREFYAALGFCALEESDRLWDPENPCLIFVKRLEC